MPNYAAGIHEMSQFSIENKPPQLGKQDEAGTWFVFRLPLLANFLQKVTENVTF